MPPDTWWRRARGHSPPACPPPFRPAPLPSSPFLLVCSSSPARSSPFLGPLPFPYCLPPCPSSGFFLWRPCFGCVGSMGLGGESCQEGRELAGGPVDVWCWGCSNSAGGPLGVTRLAFWWELRVFSYPGVLPQYVGGASQHFLIPSRSFLLTTLLDLISCSALSPQHPPSSVAAAERLNRTGLASVGYYSARGL